MLLIISSYVSLGVYLPPKLNIYYSTADKLKMGEGYQCESDKLNFIHIQYIKLVISKVGKEPLWCAWLERKRDERKKKYGFQ
jgi:hypothetical protein